MAKLILARALYADREIILMDDPLSALDSHVKRQIFEKVVLQYLQDKTRVLVTHATEYLESADKIIVMDEGNVQYCGTYQELYRNNDFEFVIDILKKIKHEHEVHNHDVIDDDHECEEENIKHQIIEYSKLTQDENEEIIDVNLKTYKQIFWSNKSWRLYIFLVPIFYAQAYFMIYTTYYQAQWVQNQGSNDYWFYFMM